MTLEHVLDEARKLPPADRRRLAEQLLAESRAPEMIIEDERLAAMCDAASDNLFLADLTATMEDFQYADHDERPA
jgi:hypothetical protein